MAKCLWILRLHLPCTSLLLSPHRNVPITERRQPMLLGKQAMSCQQAAEWGMRELQGLFPRLKDHIIYEENGE